MESPWFLEASHVLRVHYSLIEIYGGKHGIRDEGLLQSAIAMPQSTFSGQFLHADLFEMAAAYLYHLVQNHPFLDGNKRIGAASAIIFLSMNEIEIEADEEGVVAITLSVAQAIAAFFRQRVLPDEEVST